MSNVDGATPQTTNTKSDAAGFHSELYSVLSAGQPSTLRDMREIPLLTSVTANANLAEVQKVFWLPPDKDPKLRAVPPSSLACIMQRRLADVAQAADLA